MNFNTHIVCLLHSQSEHLIKQADANKDGKLTEEEILDKYRIFAGSRATHFGRHIRDKTFVHEEL